MSEIVLHHYPQSPVAEKVRTVLGIKGLSWRSVQIPRLPPKPDLLALTGGYRRTPVMQIGDDIFCDSQCIIGELERCFPEPGLFPDGRDGLAWGISRWTDECVFPLAIAVVLGREGTELPSDFAADRGRLYFGPEFDVQVLIRDLPNNVAQLRGHLGWMEAALENDQYFHGPTPGLIDALCHHLVWFVGGRFRDSGKLLREFARLCAWEQRMVESGHGTAVDMEAAQAIEIAVASGSAVTPMVDSADPLRLEAGQTVHVAPAGRGGDPEVTGELVCLSRERVAIRRRDERAGEVVVHFPRVGYRIRAQRLP